MHREAGFRALAFLHARPGASVSEYAAAAGISQPGAHHVLRRLEMEGLVHRTRVGNRVASFLTPEGVRALTNPAPRTRDLVQAVIRRQPGISRRALAHELGLGASTVQYHVRRLDRAWTTPA